MLEFDMIDHSLTEKTGPPGSIPRAEGVLLYAPAGDGGLLVYFGGIEEQNGSVSPLPMNVSIPKKRFDNKRSRSSEYFHLRHRKQPLVQRNCHWRGARRPKEILRRHNLGRGPIVLQYVCFMYA